MCLSFANAAKKALGATNKNTKIRVCERPYVGLQLLQILNKNDKH